MTVEEFAAATGQNIEDVKEKYLTNDEKNGKIASGATSGALDSDSTEAVEHAERYYEAVRKMKTDITRIARNTGFSEDEIQAIKEYIFLQKHDFGSGELEYFFPSYDMAQSWQRLIDGKSIMPHDYTLIRHELMEIELVGQGYSQDEAHIMASRKYNYRKESEEYNAKTKKH